ncbi:hypothetical protein GCM10010430_80930 [Kitasatospora cystarginea]|uniref:Uncharacterized protein n=1 Tax=Kitasatospora cystarginea TaxID=58350 RepID=A0ABN3F3J8_9ACTN
MGLSTTYLGKAEIQELLGTSSFGMWRLPRQHGDFPEPETDIYRGPFDEEPDGPVWDAHDVYRWAARTPEFQHRGAVLLRPLPGQRQPGRFLGHQDTTHGPATDWHTGIGVIRMLHTDESHAASAMAVDLAAERNREIVTVCALYGDLNPVTGLALVAADTAPAPHRVRGELGPRREARRTAPPLVARPPAPVRGHPPLATGIRGRDRRRSRHTPREDPAPGCGEQRLQSDRPGGADRHGRRHAQRPR